MRILIHCNGSRSMGLGHISRSLALVEEAADLGHSMTVVGEIESGFPRDLLSRSAARFMKLEEAPELAKSFDVVHLDTYGELPRPIINIAAQPGVLVSSMADGMFGVRPADVLIDPTLGAEHDEPHNEAATWMLRGSRYVPLRRQVRSRRGRWTSSTGTPKVLVVMGGTDAANLTPRVVALLQSSGVPADVTVVGGKPGGGRLANAGSESSSLTTLHIPYTQDLPDLVLRHDLVLTAAGTSIWEFCCIGVPIAIVQAADNQATAYKRMVAAGAAVGLGRPAAKDGALEGVEVLACLLRDRDGRAQLAGRAASLVDGLGAWRIVRAWQKLARGEVHAPTGSTGVRVRRARMSDATKLMQWRNDPVTRRFSGNPREVGLAEHSTWLAERLEDRDGVLLIGEDAHGDVGTVRWARLPDGAWEVSITVAPDRRGESLARPLLLAGEAFLRDFETSLVFLLATVHEENTVSRRVFETCGYFPDRPADERGFLRLSKQVA